MWTKFALAINLILTALLLLSILLIDDHATVLALTAVFLLFSLILKFRTLHFVALFFFLWPVFPSEPQQYGLPRFNFYEYFLVSLVFWWSLKKLLFRKSQDSVDE